MNEHVEGVPPVSKRGLIPAIAITALVSAIIAGGSVYAYQKSQADKQRADLQSQVDTFKQRLAATEKADATPTPSPTPTEQPPTTATPVATPVAKSSPVTYDSTKPFDVTKIKVGDKVGNMTVVSVQPFNPSQGAISDQNAQVVFSGEQEIGGTFTYRQGIITGVCASLFDNVSISWLPKIQAYDGETDLFCMTDSLSASEFAPYDTRWNARVIIKNYTINAYPSEVKNSAELVKVISKNTY